MFKYCVLAGALLLGLSGCDNNKTAEIRQKIEQKLQENGTLAPKAPTFDVEHYLPSAQVLAQTAQTAKADFDYIATNNQQVYYFDEQSNFSETPVANGYYRKVLGKMPDGRLVVQDFYQDTHTAQCSIIILKANGDVKSFDASHNDNSVATFDKQGEITNYFALLDDKSKLIHFIIKDKQVIGFANDDPTHNGNLFFFYPQTHILMAKVLYTAEKVEVTFYHKTGFAMLHNHKKPEDTEYKNAKFWDEKGYPTSGKKYKEQIDEMLKHFVEYIKFVENNF